MKKWAPLLLLLLAPFAFASMNYYGSAANETVPALQNTQRFISSLTHWQPASSANPLQKTVVNQESAIFKLNVVTQNNHELVAKWHIAPGNYLYRNKFRVSLAPKAKSKLGKVQIPKSTSVRNDPFFGRVKIFRNSVNIPIPVKNAPNGKVNLIIHYQGCSDAGICYAPTTKVVKANIDKVGSSTSGKAISPLLLNESAEAKPTAVSHSHSAPAVATHTSSSKFANILSHDSIFLIIIIFFGIGVLLTFTPCVLPLMPVVSGIVTGQKKATPWKSFKVTLAYVLAMSFTYAAAGVAAGYLGGTIQAVLQTPWVIGGTAVLFLLLALSMFGLYELRMPSGLQNKINTLSSKQKGGTYIGAAIMGVLSTLIISSCITAPLVGVLTFITHGGHALLGGLVLFVMSLGMGVPLLVVGVTNGALLPKGGAWMNAVKAVSGILLIGLAIWMISRLVSVEITLLLWSGFAIVLAFYIGAFQFNLKSAWGKLRQGAGVITLIYGATLMIGALSGHTNPLQPLAGTLTANGSSIVTKALPQSVVFKKIKSAAELNQQLQLAKAQHKPVLIDYYATWCADCQWMKEFTFTDKNVIKASKNFIVLQADVSQTDALSHGLEAKYNIFGPPDVILYNAKGQEVYDIVGKVDAKELYTKMQLVLKGAK